MPAALTGSSAHQCDDAYAHPAARDFIMGYRAAEDFTLPDRPFMPNFGIGNLGSPGEVRRTEETRLDRLYLRVFAIGIALALALLALSIVNRAMQPPRPQPAPSPSQKLKQAAHLRAGQSAYELDRQGCLIGMHKSDGGVIRITTVSYHC